MRRLALILVLAALGLAGSLERARAFGRGDKGTSGAQFLKIPPGARADVTAGGHLRIT